MRLALEVDLRLGARLAGAVKPEWQEQTVGLVAGLEIPQQLKNQLLSKTATRSAVSYLLQALDNHDSDVRQSAVKGLGEIGSDTAIPRLIKALEDESSDVRGSIATALGKIGSNAVIPSLLQTLTNRDEEFGVRLNAAIALGRVGNETVIPALIEVLFTDSLQGWMSAAAALSQIASKQTITELSEALEQGNADICWRAAYTLGEMGDEAAIPSLIKLLENRRFLIIVRPEAAKALGKIGSLSAVPPLLSALNDEDYAVRASAVAALGNIGDTAVTSDLLQALQDDHYQVRQAAAQALGQVGDESVVPVLIQVLESEVAEIPVSTTNLNAQDQVENAQYQMAALEAELEVLKESQRRLQREMANNQGRMVQLSVVMALGKLGSKLAEPALIKLLKNNVHNTFVIHSLGQIGSNSALPNLLQALKHEDSTIRSSAAFALGKISSETVVPELLQALNDNSEESDVIKNIAYALGKVGDCNLILPLSNLLPTLTIDDVIDNVLNAISKLQECCKFYNYTLTQPILTIATRIMHILHLSDLHFGTLDQANLWSTQLRTDLRRELSIPHLDALILSGDIANYSTQEEYKAAEQFLSNLCRTLTLNPEQIILVPGNHDLNWKLAEEAYRLERRKNYKGELREDSYIDKGDIIEVRDEEDYKQRFAHFSQFYETIKQKPYPLDYDQQYTLDHLKEQNLLILGLNSAWQLDHHYKSRASIHMGALSNALTQIDDNPEYDTCLKIAVWHHPLDSAYSDRITDQGFLEQLAVNGFRFFLHGHIHKAETSLFRYDMSTNGRKLDRICAGTFGAPVREWVPGYPLQYNLLKIEDNQLSVYTRRREELNGAWKPDARWLQGAGKTPLDYYAIAF